MTQASPPAATPRPLVTADPRHFASAFDPRHTIGLIHVDDVVADPALLAGAAKLVSAADPVTLAIVAPGWPRTA